MWRKSDFVRRASEASLPSPCGGNRTLFVEPAKRRSPLHVAEIGLCSFGVLCRKRTKSDFCHRLGRVPRAGDPQVNLVGEMNKVRFLPQVGESAESWGPAGQSCGGDEQNRISATGRGEPQAGWSPSLGVPPYTSSSIAAVSVSAHSSSVPFDVSISTAGFFGGS